MKKLTVLFAVAFALMLGSCQNTSQKNEGEETATDSVKTTLVAYFSASEVRATERVATNLAKAVDADLFEIVPELAYTTGQQG